ncbi:hypothetical protein [Bacillus pseudomycoides]|uniref:hypothetical protein n=1 Tax=Bacillus pseudomycoides TaxID=64104 RepID=UPI000BED7272|nr:hypothetical protein [Bacillus pseudomycoides]PEB42212.1 hypothetical protein COO06_07830 [Bacillus pseudomycoides]
MKASKKGFDEIVESFGGKVISINPDDTSSINPFNISYMDENEKKVAIEDAINMTLQLFQIHIGDKLTQQEENILCKLVTENDNPERTIKDIHKELLEQKQNGVTGLSRLITIYEDMVNKKKKFKNE